MIDAFDAISQFVFKFTEQQKATLTRQLWRGKGWDSKKVIERKTDTGKVSLSLVNYTSLAATAFTHRSNVLTMLAGVHSSICCVSIATWILVAAKVNTFSTFSHLFKCFKICSGQAKSLVSGMYFPFEDVLFFQAHTFRQLHIWKALLGKSCCLSTFGPKK